MPIMSANSLNGGGRPKGATFTHGNLGRVGGGRPFLPEELHDYVKDRVGACNIRARSGSSTHCPRVPPATSRSAISTFLQLKGHDNHGNSLELYVQS